MKTLLDQYKATGHYSLDDKFYYHANNMVNDAILAFKCDEDTAFYIEHPTSEDIQHFATLLEVKESNFLYLAFKSNLLYVRRKDKSYYAVYFFMEHSTKDCVVANKNSVAIIAKRFVEGSLFDGRENEVRYLKEDKWYDHGSIDAVDHPLQNLPLTAIGRDLTPYVLLMIDTEVKDRLEQPSFYLEELLRDDVEIDLAPTHKAEDIQVLEKVLSYDIKAYSKLGRGILIPFPDTDMRRDQLKTLDFNYRFLPQNKWYIVIRPEEAAFENYFLVIKWLYKDQLFFFDVRGYHSNLFIALLDDLQDLQSLDIGIARPPRRAEKVAKSTSITYHSDDGQFETSLEGVLSKEDLLKFLSEWVD